MPGGWAAAQPSTPTEHATRTGYRMHHPKPGSSPVPGSWRPARRRAPLHELPAPAMAPTLPLVLLPSRQLTRARKLESSTTRRTTLGPTSTGRGSRPCPGCPSMLRLSESSATVSASTKSEAPRPLGTADSVWVELSYTHNVLWGRHPQSRRRRGPWALRPGWGERRQLNVQSVLGVGAVHRKLAGFALAFDHLVGISCIASLSPAHS